MEITFVPHNHTHEAKAISIETAGHDPAGKPVYQVSTCTASGEVFVDSPGTPLSLPMALVRAAGLMSVEQLKFPGLIWEHM